jgi:hypothetical protein
MSTCNQLDLESTIMPKTLHDIELHKLYAMNGEDWPLVTDELVDFEK